jgi:hypothetical protein
MLTATGIAALLLGLLVFVGQFISIVNFPLAQRLGLQEKDDSTEPLHRRLELNTARWDLAVFWIVPLAGILMLLDHSWWPYLALVAGGILVDTAGRETAKLLGLRAQGVRIGSSQEVRQYQGLFGLMTAIGLWVAIYGLVDLA